MLVHTQHCGQNEKPGLACLFQAALKLTLGVKEPLFRSSIEQHTTNNAECHGVKDLEGLFTLRLSIKAPTA